MFIFFAFLWAREMTAPSDGAYDASVHLSVQDIAVDDSINPSVIRIRIKQSKTDPFRKGVDLYVGKTGSQLCPVTSMLTHICSRGMAAGPLFRFKDGRVLTRQRFVETVRDGLKKCGIDATKIMLVIASELEPLQQQPQRALRMLSSRR